MRKHLAIAAAVSLLLLLAAPVCLAEDAHGGEHAANPLSVDVVVAVGTIVVFALLIAILTKTAWKPILKGLKAREDGIRAQIEGADKANADAKALLKEYEGRLAAAAEEARKVVETGRKDAESLKTRIEAEAKAEAGRERERALRDIEIARQGALKDIYDLVATVSTDVAGRILQQKLDPAQHRRLVDESVAQYERSRKAPGAGGRA